MTAESANRRERRAPRTAWPKGQSGNPKGAPKRGESWAELFKQVGDMTGQEVADKALLWATKFKRLPKGVTLKQLVVIRAYAALLDESNARLLKEVMDRAEGKVREEIENSGEMKVVFEVVRTKIPDHAPDPAPEADAVPEQSSEAEGDRGG